MVLEVYREDEELQIRRVISWVRRVVLTAKGPSLESFWNPA